MKLSEIARVLLASPQMVPPRALHEKLGQAGYSEALRLGWIGSEPESGGVQVSSRADRREAMREAAKDGAPAPVATTELGSGLPGRNFYGEAVSPINLVTNSPSDTNPSKLPASPAPATSPTQPAAKDQGANIGDQVTVAENGQTYSARIQAKQPDGKFKLSFGGSRPARDVYGSNELSVVGKPAPV